ncbi:hypothetical protein [Stagnihabitans tardus]|nr:hypothetical protein [Stagnihabitans tardus]
MFKAAGVPYLRADMDGDKVVELDVHFVTISPAGRRERLAVG